MTKAAKDYIIFPLDVPSEQEAMRYVDLLGRDVGMFKVGLELFIRSGPEIVRFIRSSSPAGIFLDLKLHDIPATVSRAMGIVADLKVTFATVHCGETPRMLEAAVRGAGGKVAVLGVTVLTSVANEDLRSAGFREELASEPAVLVLQRAQAARSAGCAGVVCSGHEVTMIRKHLGADFVVVTPGIRPKWEVSGPDDQRRVMTPGRAVASGSDYLVIGRPIREAGDPCQAARRIAEEIEAVIRQRT